MVPFQAVVVRENGPADNLLFEPDFPTPKVADGQVLVKNEFTGINFIDTYFRKGGPAYTQALPFVSGQEGGGTIVEVTPKAVEAGLAVGQRDPVTARACLWRPRASASLGPGAIYFP